MYKIIDELRAPFFFARLLRLPNDVKAPKPESIVVQVNSLARLDFLMHATIYEGISTRQDQNTAETCFDNSRIIIFRVFKHTKRLIDSVCLIQSLVINFD